jgi:hypothetical protein
MASPHAIVRAEAWARNECTVARTSLPVCRLTQMVPMVRVSGSTPAASSTAALPAVRSGALARPRTPTAATPQATT